MKINSITSESNAALKTIRALHKRAGREKEQLFLLEGSHCLIEALKNELELRYVLASQSYLKSGMEEIKELDITEIAVVDDRLFESLATTSSACGVLAAARMPQQDLSSLAHWQPKRVVVADAIQDPGNLGTLIRTAFAAEFGGMLLLKGSVDHYNPKVVRSAAGALFALPVLSDLRVEQVLSLLKAQNYKIVVCEADGEKVYYEADLSEPVALVLGNEGQGVNPELRQAASECISIPMNPRAESLNVAISGGVILFETLRQAGKKVLEGSR